MGVHNVLGAQAEKISKNVLEQTGQAKIFKQHDCLK